MKCIINNANIVNEGRIQKGSIKIENGIISDISDYPFNDADCPEIIDGCDKYLFPGVIDTHVHFREPGLTVKADIASESIAAAAGGVTSIVDMPNTTPNAISEKSLKDKFALASEKCITNYSFYIGATNDNIDEILSIDANFLFGIKVFMGSSTGNMLVNNEQSLEKLFSKSRLPISVHCEDEQLVYNNTTYYKQLFAQTEAPAFIHPLVRNREACLKSTVKAVSLSKKYNTKLNILHLSTEDEVIYLVENKTPNITLEACISHLWFCDRDYDSKNNFIKCNPSVKSNKDRQSLIHGLNENIIDIVSTDHAPHTFEEKSKSYFNAPSGIPSIQHSLLVMLELYKKNLIGLGTIVEKMCHNPAKIFDIKKRGFIKKGYHADLALVDLFSNTIVQKNNIFYKCGWSPFEGYCFGSEIKTVIINGNIIFNNGNIDKQYKGKKLEFNR